MKYLLPYTYGLGTRAKGFFYKVSFIAIILLPMFLAYPVINRSMPNFQYVISFVIAFTGFYTIYENGYITNDYLTTRFESNPVIRLEDPDRKIEKKSEIYKAVRVLYSFCCCYVLWKYYGVNILAFASCLVIMNFVYSIHNYARGVWNIPTIFCLEIMKYITVQAAFLTGYDYAVYCIAVIICFSLERSITYSLQRRLKIKYNEDLVRLLYYCITTVVGFILLFVFENRIFLFYSIYMLLFRASCFIFTKIYDVKKIRKD